MLTHLFIKAAVQQPGRNVGRRMVVARSKCSLIEIESKSSRSCNHRLMGAKWTDGRTAAFHNVVQGWPHNKCHNIKTFCVACNSKPNTKAEVTATIRPRFDGDATPTRLKFDGATTIRPLPHLLHILAAALRPQLINSDCGYNGLRHTSLMTFDLKQSNSSCVLAKQTIFAQA